MGANLSHPKPVDLSKVTFNPVDHDTVLVRLPILWGSSIYVMFMILAMCLLADRWRGPRGERLLSTASVLAAILLSTAWPVVLVYLMVSG